MNKTITIYELLGLIKDGKAPKKIKCEGKVYEYKEGVEGTGYRFETGTFRIWFNYEINLDVKKNLNRKIEILQDNKLIIEKLRIARNDITYDDGSMRDDELADSIIEIKDKMNEIIDYINRKENK